ncbi:MAG: hypothetical protein R3B96_07685 [Pirellulaceae bacterium]
MSPNRSSSSTLFAAALVREAWSATANFNPPVTDHHGVGLSRVDSEHGDLGHALIRDNLAVRLAQRFFLDGLVRAVESMGILDKFKEMFRSNKLDVSARLRARPTCDLRNDVNFHLAREIGTGKVFG